MTKRNFFNELILQPGDDIAAAFSEQHDIPLEAIVQAHDIEHEDGLGWTCLLIEKDSLTEMQAHDFPNREALVDWFTRQGVSEA